MDEEQQSNQAAPEEGGDGWLVSYADMMTLVACFFILMMAFANYDPVGFNKKAKELSQAFNQGKYKSSEVKLSELSEEISRHPELQKKAKITLKDAELIISFSGSMIYDKGSPELKTDVIENLDVLIDMIRSRDPNYMIVIEGHSDPIEFKESKFYSSSWELASMRAAKVLARFEYFGFNSQKISAITRGDSLPVLPNFNEKGELIESNAVENRRVTIKVVEPKDQQEKLKFGFGIYFNE